jgi:superfamily I DNA/RNA helicase
MAVAGRVLASIDRRMTMPRSVRATGVPPWAERVSPEKLADRLVDVVRQEVAGLTDGRLGVLAPADLVADLDAAVTAAVPAAGSDLTSPVVVLSVRQAKGLEFDSVLVVEPEAIRTASPRGANDLYVALTRATQRLGVLYTGDLPTGLDQLASA